MTESNPDFLEEEKKKDPIERLVNLIERYAPPPPPVGAPIAPVARLAIYTGPATMELNVRTISNGYLVVITSPAPHSRAREIYVKDAVDLVAKITAETEAFAKASQELVPPIHGVDAFKDDVATAS
jgi:hypothetical protein